LAREVSSRTGIDVGKSKLALEATLVAIAAHLGGGDEVQLTGFGKFSAAQRAAREGRNPRTGERMQIAAKRVPRGSEEGGAVSRKRRLAPLPKSRQAGAQLAAARRAARPSAAQRLVFV
jgi:DNA-binding protein HU-beta